MSRLPLALAAAAFAACAALPSVSLAADVLAYEAQGNGDFGVYNFTTGVFALRGNSGGQLAGLGEVGGVVYGAVTNSNMLSIVNTATGALTAVGAGSIQYTALGSTLTSLYGYGRDNNLYSINRSTGASTLIGPTGVTTGSPYQGTFGFSTGSSTLYELRANDIFSIDTTTGLGTQVGGVGQGLFGAGVVIDGGLYLGSESPLSGWYFNPANGASIQLAAVSGTTQPFYGLAPVDGAPEPATWAMMLIGFGGLGAAMRRRRTLFAA